MDMLLNELQDGVLTLTLNRPDRLNALNPALMKLLADALADAAEDARVGCVVLRGNGRSFCAGGDLGAARDANEKKEKSEDEKAADALRAAKRGPNTPELGIDWLRRVSESVRLLHQMPKPTVAAVQGPVVGAGIGLAAACDFRIIADNATFTTGFIKVGFSGDFGGSYFITRLLGTAKARELYMLNSKIDAAEANRLGLATKLVAAADLEAETMAFARDIAKGPKIALRYMKKNLNAAEEGSLEQLLDLETQHQNRCSHTDDHKEAVKAFFEKREPVFRGS